MGEQYEVDGDLDSTLSFFKIAKDKLPLQKWKNVANKKIIKINNKSGSNDCDIISKMNTFIHQEIAEESEFIKTLRPYSAVVVNKRRIDNLHYTDIRKPTRARFGFERFDPGSWVKIIQNDYEQYGSIWTTKKGTFYLITNQPITSNFIKIVTADSLQLLRMQEYALSFFERESTQKHIQSMANIIRGHYKMKKAGIAPFEISDPRIIENDHQVEAISEAFSSVKKGGFYLVHGPPGTGKTTVITEIVRQLSKEDINILITSHTNVAVNNVMENLYPFLKDKMVRLGPRIKVPDSIKELVPETKDEHVRLLTAPIVGGTWGR